MEALEFFTNQYAFLTPLLLPWMQQLCHDSAEEQLKVLFETELATPIQLVSCTNFSYQYIGSTIIPRLIQFIERGGGKHKASEMYLRSKLAIHYSRQIQEKEAQQQKKQTKPSTERALLKALISTDSHQISKEELTKITLNSRYFELLLTDILDDLCTAFKVTNILSIEKMGIIQYVRNLIYEYQKNKKDEINFNSYSGLISCNLLSILKDKHAAECVCNAEVANLSNFKQFTDTIIENNLEFPQIKNDKENMEIDIEKLERKLKEEMSTLSEHLATGTADRMLKKPFTPQIFEVESELSVLERVDAFLSELKLVKQNSNDGAKIPQDCYTQQHLVKAMKNNGIELDEVEVDDIMQEILDIEATIENAVTLISDSSFNTFMKIGVVSSSALVIKVWSLIVGINQD